jgi:hypothetical protein
VRRQRDRDLEGKELSGGVMGSRQRGRINCSRPAVKRLSTGTTRTEAKFDLMGVGASTRQITLELVRI